MAVHKTREDLADEAVAREFQKLLEDFGLDEKPHSRERSGSSMGGTLRDEDDTLPA